MAIILDLTLKMQWFTNYWGDYVEKKEWILKVEETVKVLWLEYKGKNFLPDQSPSFISNFTL